MSEFRPVRSIADARTLDEGEVVSGYLFGLSGHEEPHDSRTRSFWHGYRNGWVDGGHGFPDEAMADLARDIARTGGVI